MLLKWSYFLVVWFILGYSWVAGVVVFELELGISSFLFRIPAYQLFIQSLNKCSLLN